MEENRKKVPFYNQIEKYMIVSMFLVMTVIIALNVVTRFVFNFTLSWGEQLARLLLVWTSFAGISWAGMINAHMRVTALSLAFKMCIRDRSNLLIDMQGKCPECHAVKIILCRI